jgi:hypothetical protein
MPQFNFVGPSYQSASLKVDAQRTVNLFPELVESGTGKGKAVLYGTPGLTVFCSLPATPIRGLWVGEGRLFAAAGTTLYEVYANGTYWAMGQIANDGLPVQMFPNGNQLFVVSAGHGYLHDGTNITQVVGAMQGAFLNGYFIAQDPPDVGNPNAVRQFHHSALLDGSTWNAGDYASKESYPDALVGILSDHQDLWLFGSQTIEVWRQNYSTDPTAFPWERDPAGAIHLGLAAPWAKDRLLEGVIWLDGDSRGTAIAFLARGYQPVRVSTHAIEAEWRTYSTLADAESFTYIDGGHEFWVLNFPTASKTWVYDATTKLWHERGWWNGSAFARHRARCHGYVWGKHLVGDHTNANIYEMSMSAYTDNGTAIHRLRTAPHISDEENRIAYHRLQLDLEVGETAAPTFTLEISRDGGKTFATGRDKQAGAQGNYLSRVLWNRLGASRDTVFRVSSTAAMRHAWVNGYLRTSAAAH